jgi:hypothetical protein
LPPTVRNEALLTCFALLGRTLNDDTLETIESGLAAFDWATLSVAQRTRFATHLRHLASQVEPIPLKEEGVQPAIQEPEREPRYDQALFGDQECLLKALREQPSNVSLNQFLKGLAGKMTNRCED